MVPYSSRWPEEFGKIRDVLARSLGNRILGIEHVGSTAVPGLWAKPILDIDIIIETYDRFGPAAECLATLGYVHEGNLGIIGREAFAYHDLPQFMPHHLYVCPENSAELRRHLVFRNHLRTHPDDAERYSAAKREAARRYPDDIDGYLAEKGICIAEIYRTCGLNDG